MTVSEFLDAYPFYLLFLIINVLIIYLVFKKILFGNDDDDKDDDDEGGISYDDPILDLPPGVTLPKEPSELVTH